MSKVKALILGLLLLVPLLIFGFISLFGEHHFTLRTYIPKLDASGEVQYAANGDTIFQQVPDFSLTTLNGKDYTASELDGDITVVHFFNTTCTTCNKISSHLVRLQEGYENYQEVKIVSITVEPEQDSAEVLEQYATTYGAKNDRWTFLTGDRQEILDLAEKGFRLPVGKQRLLREDKLMLLDKERRVRGIYTGTDLKEIDRLITEINVLRDEYSKSE